MEQQNPNNEAENEKPKEVKEIERIKELVKFINELNEDSDDESESNVTLVIRKGEAAKIYEPLKVNFGASITAPAEYAKHRPETIDASHSCVKIDHNDGSITLILNEFDPLKIVKVSGKLSISHELNKFHINLENTEYTIQQLRDKLKPLKYYFNSPDEFNSLIIKLNSFNAKVETFFKDAKVDSTGSVSKQFEQKILGTKDSDGNDTSIAIDFKINVRIYNDYDKVVVPVSLYPVAKQSSVAFKIVSQDLYEKLDTIAEELVTKTLNDIQAIKPLPVYYIGKE